MNAGVLEQLFGNQTTIHATKEKKDGEEEEEKKQVVHHHHIFYSPGAQEDGEDLLFKIIAVIVTVYIIAYVSLH